MPSSTLSLRVPVPPPPLFFDPNGHNDKLIPTIHALSILPTLVPTLYTHSEVSPKILGGADLFLQGIILPPGEATIQPPFLCGTVRSVSVPGNPIPFAVGMMAVSSTEAVREGMKGKGLTVLHGYGDLLWNVCAVEGSASPPPAPNQGFTPTMVLPVLPSASEAELSGASMFEKIQLNENNKDFETVNGGNDVHMLVSQQQEEHEQEKQGQATTLDQTTTTAAAASSAVDNLDNILECAVIGGLKSLKAAELPILTSDFYQKHMLPLRPPGLPSFDFKASTKYKKLSRLLDTFEKDKVITIKQIRKQDHISAVNRFHPLMEAYTGMPAMSLGFGNSSSGSNGDSSNGVHSGRESSSSSAVTIEYCYRPPSALRPLFVGAGGEVVSKDVLYREEEVEQALTSYAHANGLLLAGTAGTGTDNDGNRQQTTMKLDHVLATGLWGKKEGPEEGSAVEIDFVFKRLLSKVQLFHRIVRIDTTATNSTTGPIEVVRKGRVKPISIVAEKRKGHNVTAVSHVESFGFHATQVAADFQRRFKTSCSTSKLPGKTENDYEILMQGDLAVNVTGYFADQGIDVTKFVEVNNKLSAPKKKN